MLKTIISLITVIVLALIATPAHALIAINGDFDAEIGNPGTPPPGYVPQNNYTGTAAAPDTGTVWTPIIFLDFDGPPYYSIYQSSTYPIPLLTSTGSSSPVTFQADINSNIIDSSGDPTGPTANYSGEPDTDLTRDYMYAAPTSYFSFNNVPASLNGYALYLYSSSASQGSATAFTITTGLPSSSTLIADQTQGTFPQSPTSWIPGVNYVEFTGLNPSGGVISGSFTAATTAHYGFPNGSVWNGFQLVELPEPASMSLLAMGGLMLLKRRRV